MFRCKGRHHTSICKRVKEDSRQQTNNDKSSDSKKSNDNKDNKEDDEQKQQLNASRTATYTVMSNNKAVLMQTAKLFQIVNGTITIEQNGHYLLILVASAHTFREH